MREELKIGTLRQSDIRILEEAESLWAHDIQSAWELVDQMLADRGHDEFGREDIIDLMGRLPFEELTADPMTRMIEDYEDR